MPPKKHFSFDPSAEGPKTGVDELLGAGPESIARPSPVGGSNAPAGPLPPELPPRPLSAEDPLVVYEQRMMANFASRRNPLNMTAAATPELKAKVAVIGRAAEDILGSRQFTESAVIRGLVELLVVDAGINWPQALRALSPELAARPVEATKAILRQHLQNE